VHEQLVSVQFDSVAFRLRETMDFSWLHRLGKAFVVFDEQDSGNLCFGVERGGSRLFVKYAGARTREYAGEPEAAIQALKAAAKNYQVLRHPSLVNLVDLVEPGTGAALVFDWREGECLHPHWRFPSPAKYTDPASPFYRFRCLSVDSRLQAFDTVLAFHCFVEDSGYLAVDFYDGSIMYDFATFATAICDIDYYRRGPYTNDIGRMWGSSRFMSPEEFSLGSVIDSRTNVYGMGATAFCLLGDDKDRSANRWVAGRSRFEVASRAVREDRSERHASVREFRDEWNRASG
jgi:serine/threonine protein kinase, bacterial